MPSVPNCRRVKKSTVLVKKTQLKQKCFNNKSRNLWFERFKTTKANNNALARALSKEKQESQYLFTQNINLTSQLHDLETLLNNRDELLSGILNNSTEALKLLVQVTNCVTKTIVSCQTVVGKPQLVNSRSSLNNIDTSRRESTRLSSGKSPARGVVQPMVSGHTITKPVINLSRINMPRIQTASNLSVINESIDGVEGTPQRNSLENRLTPRRVPVNQINHMANQCVQGLMPERLRLSSPRMSQDNEQNSNERTRRLSNKLSHRKSRRISRRSDQQEQEQQQQQQKQSSVIESLSVNDDSYNRSRSPRVALQDVSLLLQNSHSINIRTLIESRDELLIGSANGDDDLENSTKINGNDDNLSPPLSNESSSSSPTYGFDPRTKKKRKSKRLDNSKNEDPLEGPSWLYNSSSSSSMSPSVNSVWQNNTPNVSKSKEITNSNCNSSLEHSTNRQPSKFNSTNANESSESSKAKWGETYCTYRSDRIENDDNSDENNDENINERNDDDDVNDGDDDYDDDGERCQNLSRIVEMYNGKKEQNDEFRVNTIEHSENITRQRGVREIDDDDFTMIFNRKSDKQSPKMDFDINELNLPTLEQPLINPVEVEPEPEITTTIKMITQTYRHRVPSMTIHDNMDASLMENTSVIIPAIRDSSIQLPSDFDMNNSQDKNDDNDTEETSSFIGYHNSNTRKRRRANRNYIESSSDSEPSPSEKKTSAVEDKQVRRKDPSSAKVVLEKLKESKYKKTLSSSNSNTSTNLSVNSVQSDAHSDSEGSNASSMMSSGRPRRQKAPVNLKEPKLKTKMRR